MNGVLGWVGARIDGGRAALERMATRPFEGHVPRDARIDDSSAIAATGPAVPAVLHEGDGLIVALVGHPRWRSGNSGESSGGSVAARFAESFRREGAAALASLDGDYALALIEPARSRALLAVDRMSIRNIVYAMSPGGLVFGPTCDAVLGFPGLRAEIDAQGIYDYLHFHMIPGPSTAFRGVLRVPPGHHLEFAEGRSTVRAHWQPRFLEDEPFEFDTRKRAFRSALEGSVRDLSAGSACGTFLSGGTDSSTLAGMLGNMRGGRASTFSIGFDAAGYDEMHYARLAARHFGTDQHEYYVTPDDVVDAIPRIADAYDQPFGNASAVPTFHCAKLARDHGMQRLLGGDGGDELYGGNARYAKQYQFALYDRIPAPLRNAMIQPLIGWPWAARVPLLRKAQSYVSQASTPMPERYDAYNLLERLGPSNVLAAEFLATVDPHAPMRRMREVWSNTDAKSLVNRMLAMDFQFTLADNDLPKVTRMCELAGIDVAFPMLSSGVIDVSLGLPPDQKLRGTQLRYFFKNALSDFLPAEILSKEKHGFGLPVGTWLLTHAGLRELAGDLLSRLRTRRIVRPEFIDRLLGEHLGDHAGYYGAMVWILMMLEAWYGRHSSASRGS